MCPTGMKLDIDWKTCIPENPDAGSTTVCENGYMLNSLTNNCDDINECDK